MLTVLKRNLKREVEKLVKDSNYREAVMILNKKESRDTYTIKQHKLIITNDLGVVHYHISMSPWQEDSERPYASIVLFYPDDERANKFREIYGGTTIWCAIQEEE